MPAMVIAERIGCTRGMTVLSARVRELRPVYLPADPSSRTAYVAGEIAQNDYWFPDIELPVGFGQTRTATLLPVLTMVSAYSPMLFARLVLTRTGLAGPGEHAAPAGVWLRPGGPCRGGHRDDAALLPVPATTGWHSTRLPRDSYVRLDGNDYSVRPSVIGRRVQVTADLDRVRAFCEGRLVADHLRVWARHQSLTAPEHDTAAKAHRWDRIDGALPVTQPEVESRDLRDYDTPLGTGDAAGSVDVDGTVA